MKKEFTCYKWLIRDNQQLCYPDFILSKKHYKSRKDVDKDYATDKTEYCFHPIRPIRESKITGEMAEHIYYHERRER